MSKIFNILKLKLLIVFKDKKGLIFLITLPLVFTFIFGKAFGSGATAGVPITVADLDNSPFSQKVITQLKDDKALEVKTTDEKEAIAAVQEKSSDLAVIIPMGFGQSLRGNQKVDLRTVSLPNSNSAYSIRELIGSAVDRVEANTAAANETVNLLSTQKNLNPEQKEEIWQTAFAAAEKKWTPEPPMSVGYSEVTGKGVVRKDYNNMTFYSLGLAVAFVMYTITFSAGSSLEEKASGTWGRLLSTPTRPWQILTGQLVFAYIMGWVQTGVLIVAGKYIFGVDWGSNLPGMLLIMGVYLFAITGLGLMLSGFVKTNAQLQAVTPLVMASSAMIGGCYWSLDMVPKGMQMAAKFLPTGQAMQGLLDLVARGKDLADVQQPIYILLGMGVLFFAVGLKRIKFE